MKPEEQRIAIAKYCGWTSDRYHTLWTRPDKTGRYYLTDELPDYLNDLNAMHEAENYIMDESSIVYLEWLARLSCVWHATAAQRAEAFLRTIGKWTE